MPNAWRCEAPSSGGASCRKPPAVESSSGMTGLAAMRGCIEPACTWELDCWMTVGLEAHESFDRRERARPATGALFTLQVIAEVSAPEIYQVAGVNSNSSIHRILYTEVDLRVKLWVTGFNIRLPCNEDDSQSVIIFRTWGKSWVQMLTA